MLTANAVASMQRSLLSQQGDLLEGEKKAVPAVVLMYYRQQLQSKLSGGIAREALTLSYIADLLLRGQPASASDVIVQRLKALDLQSSQIPWSVAQRVELAPKEGVALAGRVETTEAARQSRAEYLAYHPRPSGDLPGRTPRFDQNTRPAANLKGKGKGKKGKEKDGSKDQGKGERKKDG